MEFSLKNQDATSARLVVKIVKEDYQSLVDKSLKSFRQKANIPGFRPGMVPMGLIKKQYGVAVKAEEINKLLQSKIFEYIKENKIDILGEPLPDEEQQSTVDFASSEDFEFDFLMALAPTFDATLSSEDKLTLYKIQPTDEMIENQVKSYAQRCGDYQKVETYLAGDMLKGTLSEVAEGGLEVESATILPSYMKNDEQKALFEGKKVGDTVLFNPSVAFGENEAELASLLKVDKKEVANKKGDFSLVITEITRFVPSELNQTVFDAAYGKDTVTNEADFRARIKADFESRFAVESDYKLLMDTRDYLMKRIGKMEFSEALLKRLMMSNNPEKDEAYVAEYFEKSLTELSWHLIKEQLTKKFEVKIEEADVLEVAKEATRDQFAQYGMSNVPEDLLENYAREMLKKENSHESLINRAVDMKLIEVIKSTVTLKNKNISVDDFNKMVAQND